MSFFSDLFEGNFGNLGNDLAHAPSSFINHPADMIETGAAALLVAAPFLAPEIIGGGGAALGADAALGAADLGAADAAFGAFDTGLFAANSADAALGLGGVDALASGAGGLSAFAGDALAGSADAFTGGAFASDPGLSAIDTAFGPAGGVGDTAAAPSFSQGEEWSGLTGAGANASADSGGGLTKTLGDTMSSPWTKLALGAAPLALALGRGQPPLPGQIDPAQANASALASQGSNLNPAQAATVAQMKQDLTNQWRQVLYNQGVKDISKDSRWPQIEAQIDQQTTAATQQMIQQNIQNSLAGDAQLIQIAQMQMNADQNFTNTLVNATAAFGRVAGGGNTITLKAA
jgi:hypothetical protein